MSPRTEGEPVRVRCVFHCRRGELLYSLGARVYLDVLPASYILWCGAYGVKSGLLMNVEYINDLLRGKTIRNSPVLPKRERCVQTRGHWNSLPFLFSPDQNWMIRTPLSTKSDLVSSLTKFCSYSLGKNSLFAQGSTTQTYYLAIKAEEKISL